MCLASCARHQPVTVGFIYDNDETTPYSYSFFLAQEALQETYGSDVNILLYSNVLDEDVADTAKRLSDRGCQIIFTNSYGDMMGLARDYPDIQFCQVSNEVNEDGGVPKNYHTFKGEIYQARYLSGVVAGLKLQQMIEQGKVDKSKATVGFVAAYPYPEVISGYTSFILGVRSVVDTATLKVKYANAWNNYALEKSLATELLDEGCSIISQHTDTIGPAVACEEYYAREVYHVGYNVDMTDVAPHVSITSARIDWSPYLVDAVKAIMTGKRIEDVVSATEHPFNDMSGGLKEGWVELTPLNEALLPDGTDKMVEQVSAEVGDGTRQVFFGPYKGVNPQDPKDTIDLTVPFFENENSSVPSFNYLLDGIVTIEE